MLIIGFDRKKCAVCKKGCAFIIWIWLQAASTGLSNASQTNAPFWARVVLSVRVKKKKMWSEIVIIGTRTGGRGSVNGGHRQQCGSEWVSAVRHREGEGEGEGEREDGQPPSKMASPEENDWKILKRGLLSFTLPRSLCFPAFWPHVYRRPNCHRLFVFLSKGQRKQKYGAGAFLLNKGSPLLFWCVVNDS